MGSFLWVRESVLLIIISGLPIDTKGVPKLIGLALFNKANSNIALSDLKYLEMDKFSC